MSGAIHTEQGLKEEFNAKEGADPSREEDLFSGGYEEYIENIYKGDKNYTSNFSEAIKMDIESITVKNKRKQNIKIIIKRKKKEFESPLNFNDRDNDSQNLDAKPQGPKEYVIADRAYLEIGLQTANENTEKSYQVPKVRTQNKQQHGTYGTRSRLTLTNDAHR